MSIKKSLDLLQICEAGLYSTLSECFFPKRISYTEPRKYNIQMNMR